MLQAMVVILLVLMSLTGCSENYRYPCQDPDNWEKKECKKPYCSANGTCPEDLTLYEKDKAAGQTGNSVAPAAPRKGECK
jgi:hypothetical protein